LWRNDLNLLQESTAVVNGPYKGRYKGI